MKPKYKAFISYRRLPLETWAAKKIHRLIEHYRIPKELRQNGEKRLGRVFRDQDELELASDLDTRIHMALDASEFLIVICSPATLQSPWVMREINYFLLHHDRDHVLAVLVDGSPETAFPAQLTEIRDENGEVVGRAEAIAAYLVAPTRLKREKQFRVESLRILAALLGCSFDSLFRRELRWRMRRFAAAAALVLLIAASFIGLLLNRNARIEELLRQTQINESRALAVLSEQADSEGDYLGALQLALSALPGTGGERPYVAQAERALAGELNVYRQGAFVRSGSVEQDSPVFRASFSADGAALITENVAGMMHVWDAATGAERWKLTSGLGGACRPWAAGDALLVFGAGECGLYAMADGAPLWTRNDLSAMNFRMSGETGTLGLAFSVDGPETLSLIELASGKTRRVYPIGPGFSAFCPAALDREEARAAFLLEDGEGAARLCLLTLADGEVRVLDEALPYTGRDEQYTMLFTEDGALLLCCADTANTACLRLYGREKDYALRFAAAFDAEWTQESFGRKFFSPLALFDCRRGRIVCGCQKELVMLDASDGTLLWKKRLPGALLAAAQYRDASIGLVLADGTLAHLGADGETDAKSGSAGFTISVPLSSAAAAGESWESGVFAMTAAASPQSCCLVRRARDGAMRPLAEAVDDLGLGVLLASPDGALAVRLLYSAIAGRVFCQRLDPVTQEAGALFELPNPDAWIRVDRLSLTNDGVLLGDVQDLDLKTMALTAARTGALPEYLADADVSVRGERLAVGATELSFTVYDRADGRAVSTGSFPSAPGRLLLAQNDTVLLALLESGSLYIYDTESGTQLNSCRLNRVFPAAATAFSCAEFEDEQRLLAFLDDRVEAEPLCIALETEGWDCVGVYTGAAAWLPAVRRVLVVDAQGGLWLSPRHTLDDMTETAQGLLRAAAGPAEIGGKTP